MKKLFFPSFTLIFLIAVTSCATNITKINTSGPYTYKINTLGISKNVQAETINTANNLCRSLNKDYRFIRNIVLPKSVMGVDMISYDLIFSCVDPGSAPIATPDAGISDTPENAGVPESLPDSEENFATPEEKQDREKKLAATGTGARQDKKSIITGDTPGAPESLGNPPPSKELELQKEEGVIIEEHIFE